MINGILIHINMTDLCFSLSSLHVVVYGANCCGFKSVVLSLGVRVSVSCMSVMSTAIQEIFSNRVVKSTFCNHRVVLTEVVKNW